MPRPSDAGASQREALNNLLGLGSHSARKSHYPELLARLEELETERNRYKWLFEHAVHGIFQASVREGLQGKPVFYLSWLNLDAKAQARYLSESPLCIPDADWNSGECMWIHDWVAPFGHTRLICRLLQRPLLAKRCVRTLYHRGEERGLRVKTFQGIGVMPAEARAWFAAHPLPVTG